MARTTLGLLPFACLLLLQASLVVPQSYLVQLPPTGSQGQTVISSQSASVGVYTIFPSAAGLTISSKATNAVLDWNIAAQWLVRNADANNVGARIYALLHLAIWQCLQVASNATQPLDPTPFVAYAAHLTLGNLFPQYYNSFDSLLAEQIAPYGNATIKAAQDITAPIVVSLLASRLNDGTQAYVPLTTAPFGTIGAFQQIPGSSNFKNLPQYASALPLLLPDPIDQLTFVRQAQPPEPIPSTEYDIQYSTVELLGSVNSTVRSQYQTDTAYFWSEPPNGTSGVTGHIFQAALAMMPGNMTVEKSAEIMAHLAVGIYDSSILALNLKYKWGRWRPGTGISTGDPDHAPQPDWTPLLTTPDNPSYPSVQGCLAGLGQGIFDWYFGNVSFTLGTEVVPPYGYLQPRQYTSFPQAALEIVSSRYYGGTEFPEDSLVGRQYGLQAADYIIQNFDQLSPLNKGGHQ